MGSLSLLCCEMKVDCWPSFVCGILALFVLLLCTAGLLLKVILEDLFVALAAYKCKNSEVS